MKQAPQHPPADATDCVRTNRIVTIPNIICVFRMLGAIWLIALAFDGASIGFIWLFVGLAMSDWLDGKLAILLNQRSVWGPRLDSWADLMLYAALFFGTLVLQGDTLSGEWVWISLALTSYTISTLAGLWKYHRWPSYHTRAAKISWFLILIGAVCLLGNWSLWPLRVALIAIIITNIETIAITLLSSNWRDDAGSILQVMRDRRAR